MDRKTKPPRRSSPKRKRRTEEPDDNAREPTQERSRLRFDAILRATDQLLQQSNIENISMYDIAAKASMPAASVHYLFPTVDSIYVKLAERYMQLFAAASAQHRTERKAQTWQDNIRTGLERACKQYNDNRGALELLLGPRLGRVVELQDIRNNDIIAESVLERLSLNYELPRLPRLRLRRILSFGLTITDAFWSRSYMEHGRIDAETLEESIRAQLAYLKLYLPEHLPMAE